MIWWNQDMIKSFNVLSIAVCAIILQAAPSLALEGNIDLDKPAIVYSSMKKIRDQCKAQQLISCVDACNESMKNLDDLMDYGVRTYKPNEISDQLKMHRSRYEKWWEKCTRSSGQ